jgi:hypothetical protein
MDHQAFLSRTKKALKEKSDGRPKDAVAELRSLLQDLGPAMKTAVNDWHQQQALNLLVDALDVAGSEDECRAAWEELIRFNQDVQTYWQIALSSAREDFARWTNAHSPRTKF